MADLENLLLEAAGRKIAGKKSLSNSDHEHDGASMEASDQIPFKKRHAQTEVGEEDDDDDSDVGSDLYKDNDDREMLAAMTELEREIILSDRAAKRDDKRLREKMKQKLNEKRPVNPPRRSLARNVDRDNVLTRLRLKQRDSKSGWEKHPVSAGLTSSSDDDDDGHDEAEVESCNQKRVAGSDPDPPYFDDVKGITIRRSNLRKWFMEPFFEELIVGCFVRVGIGMSESGPVYRLCQVSSVDASDLESEYSFEGKRTHKCLVCFWGSESSAAKWKMAMVSDSDPTEEEFGQWAREVEWSGGRAPKRREVLEKIESIERAGKFVYSAKAVKQMLEEKKKKRGLSSRPVNVAVEKERLRRKLEAAESRSDKAEADQIRARLLELEEARRAEERDAKAMKLAEMNKRNRAENLKNTSSERLRGSRAGDAGYDPFSRRWTRSRNCYEGKAGGVGRGGEAVAEKNKGMKPEADSDGRKSAESGAAIWNVEIVISLDKIDGFGPQGVKLGYMARKQRIEAMIGRRVVENYGKRGSLILTVSDYRKRRGML